MEKKVELDNVLEKYIDSVEEIKLDEDVSQALFNDIGGFVQSDDMNKFQSFFIYLQDIIRQKSKKNMELTPLIGMIGRVIDEIRKIGD